MKKKKGQAKRKFKLALKDWQLYLMMVPAILYIAVFAYKPMYGILIAFKNFSIKKGVWGSPWVGFDNFERLFNSYWFPVIMKNTLTLSGLTLILGFPIPIILALLLNEVKKPKFRSAVQTVSYAPHFISTVVMCGMLVLFLDPTNGFINKFLVMLGFEAVPFMQEPELFKWVYVLSGVWQTTGWNSIIYFAALSSVDKALLEAAEIDGATRMQRIWHINLPEIIPTIMITLILRCGQLLSVGYEKVYLLQNATNLSGSEIIYTYVYKVGLENSDFAFSTATSLFNTVINVIILVSANQISKKVTKSGLF